MRSRSYVTLVASAVVALGAAALWAGLTIDVPVTGKKLLIRDNADPAKRKMIYRSKDPSFATAGMDPVVTGARMFLLNQGAPFQVDVFELPAPGWTAKGNGEFEYKDKAMANGPIIEAKLKTGLIKVTAKGAGMTFTLLDGPPEGQGTISAHLVIAEYSICTVFPGAEGKLKKDDSTKGAYLATDAEAPAMSCSLILD